MPIGLSAGPSQEQWCHSTKPPVSLWQRRVHWAAGDGDRGRGPLGGLAFCRGRSPAPLVGRRLPYPRLPLAKRDSAWASSSFFQPWKRVRWTPKWLASYWTVLSPLRAARATWALNAGECCFRMPAIVSPFLGHLSSLLSGPVFGVHYNAIKLRGLERKRRSAAASLKELEKKQKEISEELKFFCSAFDQLNRREKLKPWVDPDVPGQAHHNLQAIER